MLSRSFSIINPLIGYVSPVTKRGDLFRLYLPPRTLCTRSYEAPRVILHSKSLCKNMARASGGGITNGKDPNVALYRK